MRNLQQIRSAATIEDAEASDRRPLTIVLSWGVETGLRIFANRLRKLVLRKSSFEKTN